MGRVEQSYDFRQILERADRARVKGQGKKALRLYRWALACDRSSVEIHQKLAPLLAAADQNFDAWNSYRALAQTALREGREDRAIAVYREATHALPREIQAWQGLARLLVRQSEDAAAVECLVEGSRQFRSHWNRPEAIHLLRRARSIAPWHFEVVTEMARHLARADQKLEARMLLDGLEGHCEPHLRHRLHAAQLSIHPGPGRLWRWIRSAFQRPEALALPAFEPCLAELPASAQETYPPLRAVSPYPDAAVLATSASEPQPLTIDEPAPRTPSPVSGAAETRPPSSRARRRRWGRSR